MVTEATTIKIQTCNRCGHEWAKRKKGNPIKCPACKSPYWDDARKRPRIGKLVEEYAVVSEEDLPGGEPWIAGKWKTLSEAQAAIAIARTLRPAPEGCYWRIRGMRGGYLDEIVYDGSPNESAGF